MRVHEELELLRSVYPNIEYQEQGGVHWVRIRPYRVPKGWSHPSVEVAFQVPASPGQAPYAFWVRPGLQVGSEVQPGNYSYPVSTPWGSEWGQFSWSPVHWVPMADIRAGANMLNFVQSFRDRFLERA